MREKMTTLYRCPSVRSNKVIEADFHHSQLTYVVNESWFFTKEKAIEANRIKRNKLIARKSREIEKLAEVY
jgi:hypothetical protein